MYVGMRLSDPGVTDSCYLPSGGWEFYLGPLEEWAVPLTAESSLQPIPGFLLGSKTVQQTMEGGEKS